MRREDSPDDKLHRAMVFAEALTKELEALRKELEAYLAQRDAEYADTEIVNEDKKQAFRTNGIMEGSK